MIKVGITGQTGFIGTHLINQLRLYPEKYHIVDFQKEFFYKKKELIDFIRNCDVIVHLAAMNRHNEPQKIYDTNLSLANILIDALIEAKADIHLIYSSSVHEFTNNLYGKSKKQCRLVFEDWAHNNNKRFTGCIIPNTFGPFGHPYYNSVIATFCHQLTHNETPKIEIDKEIGLVYVDDVVIKLIEQIDYTYSFNKNDTNIRKIELLNTVSISVFELLSKLITIHKDYFNSGIIPSLKNDFDKSLFNTYLCYIDHNSFFPFKLKYNLDNRGSFVETIRLNSGGQISYSTTVPGITRGNHFHTRKAERFAVIKGKARIEIRRIGTDKVHSFILDGSQPSFVDMPIWYTHNITNIGDTELYTLFWISEHFGPNDPDTYFEKV